MTVYAKFVEREHPSSGAWPSSNDRILQIGSATAGGDPRFSLYRPSGSDSYTVLYDPGTGVTKSVDLNPSWGDEVELRGVLNADGSVLISGAVNGGTETSSDASSATPLASAWADTRLYINSAGAGNIGIAQFAAVKVARGTKTLAEMRAL